jgi:hypothetical protein
MSLLKVNSLQDLGADPVVTNGVIERGAFPAGSIIDVKSVTKTDNFSASVSTGASADITDLSITHSIAKAGNKILLFAQVGTSGTSGANQTAAFAFAEDGNLLAIGDASGSRARVGSGVQGFVITGSESYGSTHHLNYLHSPTTGSKTYTLRAINPNTGTLTLYVNRTGDANNRISNIVSASSITLMEVAG